jgi:hypothetical protein
MALPRDLLEKRRKRTRHPGKKTAVRIEAYARALLEKPYASN